MMAGRATPTLVLASRSPQRRAILEQLAVRFTIRPVDVEEIEDGPPHEAASANALRKATAAAWHAGPGQAVLGVDTVVALDGRIWGKPADGDEAARTLSALAGRTHEVLSGLALIEDGREARTALARTRVRFRALDDALVAGYVATGEWEGRAGGYAIQGRGALLVAGIEGDYFNVVGLPVAALAELWPALLDLGA
jgi:septum formation protein